MWAWLRSAFARAPASASVAVPERPVWADELLDSMQKLSRVTAKQAARLEAAVGETDARLAAVVTQLRAHSDAGAGGPRSDVPRFDELFDALDALDQACELAQEVHLADGLSRIKERLSSFLEQSGYSRVTATAGMPNPRLMRVVGSEPRADRPAGSVARMVRAAIVAGTRVVREGEVITSTEIRDHEERLGN
jgi:hypothetical protein